jgi:hypothetical protein
MYWFYLFVLFICIGVNGLRVFYIILFGNNNLLLLFGNNNLLLLFNEFDNVLDDAVYFLNKNLC